MSTPTIARRLRESRLLDVAKAKIRKSLERDRSLERHVGKWVTSRQVV